MHKICSLKWSQMRWATCLCQRCLRRDCLKYSAVGSQILTRLKVEDRHSANKVNYSTGWWIIQFFNNSNQCKDYQTHGSDSHLSISGDGRVLIDAVIFWLDIPLWEFINWFECGNKNRSVALKGMFKITMEKVIA